MTFRPFPHNKSSSSHALELIESVEITWHCRVTIHDQLGRLSREGLPMLPRNHNMHTHSYCRWKRQSQSGWHTACNQHCLYNMGKLVLRGAGSHSCWKGGREVVCPVIINNAHMLTVFGGVFRGDMTEEIKENPVWLKRWNALPEITDEDSRVLALQLRMLGHHLCFLAQPQSRSATSRKERIEHFLAVRAHGSIFLGDLAADLGLSEAQCSREVKRLMGVSFKKMLQIERLKRAAILLQNSELNVGEVALRVGFSDPYHFNRSFRKQFGSPPGAWRKLD